MSWLDVANWGLWLGPAHEVVACVLMIVYAAWGIGAIFWDAYWRPWTCRGCGNEVRGTNGKDGWRYPGGDCCEKCAWTPITHAQYNRMFDIPPKIRRIK